jgi:hypothetical protein
MTANTVNPWHTVTLEEAPPSLEEQSAGSDEVTFSRYSPDNVDLQVETTAAAGMLVLSDVVDPAWTVRVDGVAAKMSVADAAPRAVAAPAGKHTVEFQHASMALALGGLTLRC